MIMNFWVRVFVLGGGVNLIDIDVLVIRVGIAFFNVAV